MREAIRDLPGSKIREVANAGIGRDDVLAFWFGESDEVTPEPIRQAAAESLARGETFYSHNLGLPELRAAIAAYGSGLHQPLDAGRVAVTSSGVSALMLAMQMLVGHGDEVVAVVPVWPNLTAQPAILGAGVTRVPLRPRGGAWQLDLQELLAAVTPRTRVLLVNAPNNPTGWTLTRAEQQVMLDHCRRTGTWIVADEVYERVYFGDTAGAPGPRSPAAPSFLDIAAPADRLVVVHSFSKSFLMTGWRLGWLVLPPSAMDAAGKLLEFNSSCAPVFVQRGGVAALALADELRAGVVARLRGLSRPPGEWLGGAARRAAASPPGGMYAFFRVDGEDDSLALCQAPGGRAGPGAGAGRGLRRRKARAGCAGVSPRATRQRLDQGLQRLAAAIRL